MDKSVLYDYMDACALIKETEADIQRLKKKKKTMVQTSVSGSNPDFPYNPQRFKIEGTVFTYVDDCTLRHEEKLLEERRANAKRIKLQVEQWMLTIPARMQRIIRFRCFQKMTWGEVAIRIGGRATAESVRKEFDAFMKIA